MIKLSSIFKGINSIIEVVINDTTANIYSDLTIEILGVTNIKTKPDKRKAMLPSSDLLPILIFPKFLPIIEARLSLTTAINIDNMAISRGKTKIIKKDDITRNVPPVKKDLTLFISCSLKIL